MISFNEWLADREVIVEGLRAVRFKESGGKRHMATFGNVQLRLMKDTETGEFVVAWFEGNKYDENKSYRTDNAQDALGTMSEMGKRLLAQQATHQNMITPRPRPQVPAPQSQEQPYDPGLDHLTYDELSPRP